MGQGRYGHVLTLTEKVPVKREKVRKHTVYRNLKSQSNDDLYCLKLDMFSKMATPPKPLAPGKSYISHIPPINRDGHRCYDLDDVMSQVHIFSSNYPERVPIPVSNNIWGEPAKEIVRAIVHQRTITGTEKAYLSMNIGFMYQQIVQEYTEQVKSNMTLVRKDFSQEELGAQIPMWDTGNCQDCYVKHISDGLPGECRLVNGPLAIELVREETLKPDRYKAVMIGSKHLQVLSTTARREILNLGLIKEVQYPAPWSDAEAQLYFSGIDDRLLLTGRTMKPVFIEFTPLANEGKIPTQLFRAVMALAELQRRWESPIILVVPPYFPKPGEKVEDYNEGKKLHQHTAAIGVYLGRMVGLAVCPLLIQTVPYNEGYHLINPDWHGEPLFNKDGRQTREYLRRCKSALLELTEALQVWMVPDAERSIYVGYRSLDPADVEARE